MIYKGYCGNRLNATNFGNEMKGWLFGVGLNEILTDFYIFYKLEENYQKIYFGPHYLTSIPHGISTIE